MLFIHTKISSETIAKAPRNIGSQLKMQQTTCVDVLAQMFGAYLTTTRSERIVDKYPELIFRVDFVRALFPDARFIFLVRNGWDTCHSIANWSKRLGVQRQWRESMTGGGLKTGNGTSWLEQLVKTDPAFSEIADAVKHFDRHLDRAAIEWISYHAGRHPSHG